MVDHPTDTMTITIVDVEIVRTVAAQDVDQEAMINTTERDRTLVLNLVHEADQGQTDDHDLVIVIAADRHADRAKV